MVYEQKRLTDRTGLGGIGKTVLGPIHSRLIREFPRVKWTRHENSSRQYLRGAGKGVMIDIGVAEATKDFTISVYTSPKVRFEIQRDWESLSDEYGEFVINCLLFCVAAAGLKDTALVTRVGKSRTRRRSYGYVYFIQSQGTGLIKIGFSRQPLKRLAVLRTAHGCDVKLLACVDGSMSKERKLHADFAHLRENGEWFRPDKALMGAISEAQNGNIYRGVAI